MRAVWMVAACELRRRWRGVVLLAVVVGIVGAVVLAAAAGARRSDSALGRFNRYSRSADVELLPMSDPTLGQLRAIGRAPGVAAMAVLRAYGIVVPRAPDLLVIAAPVDGKFGSVVDRDRIVAGRRAAPSVADEITIGEGLAALLHVRPGGHLDAESYSPGQVAAGLGPGTVAGPPAGPRLRLRVVGIVRRPWELGEVGASGGVLILTPAFDRANSDRIGTLGTFLRVRTQTGAAGVPRVVAAARRILGQSSFLGLAIETEGARDAIAAITLELWILAGVAALAGVVAVGIALTRQISLVSVDHATVRALGITRAQRVAISAAQALPVAGGSALLATLGAGAASPLFPLGVAGRAEPDPGLHLDWTVLTLGIVAVGAVVLAVAFLAALRSTERSAVDVVPGVHRRTSTVVEAAARSGLAPTATNGLRMALQPGRGESALPVRSAFLGAVFGVLGITAVLVLVSSLDHLVATPRLYGWTWDFKAADVTANTPCGREAYGLVAERDLAAVAGVCYQNIQLDGRPLIALAFTSLRGAIGPEVVAGRAPRGPHEVALGTATLHALGKSIGDTVHAGGPHTKLAYRIVGRIVLPTLGQPQPLADGAALTGEGFSPLFDPNNFHRYLVGRFAPGVDRTRAERRIAAIQQLGKPAGPTVPVEVTRLRQIDWFPATLAALLGGLALLAVGHALFTAVRRRRRELALLKALGFDRRQVRATVAWHATTLATVGLVVGIPAGLIVGRIAWRLVADGLGVSTTAVIPALVLFLTIPSVLALINLIAVFPAHAATQTPPAVALRTE